MPAVTSIALADALATPVTHTFIPLGPDKNGVWWFEDQSAANAVGYWRISLALKRPEISVVPATNGANRMFRVKVDLHEPVLEVVSNSTVSGITPAPTISYVSRSTNEFVLPERSTLQNRKDLRKMTASLLADPQVIAMVETLQPVF